MLKLWKRVNWLLNSSRVESRELGVAFKRRHEVKYWRAQSREREPLSSYPGPGAGRVGRGGGVPVDGIFLVLHYENQEYFLSFGNNQLKMPGLP